MEQCQAVEVEGVVAFVRRRDEQIERRLQRVDEVLTRRAEIGQLELPAVVVRQPRRGVAAVGIAQDRRQLGVVAVAALAAMALQVARDPELLEPADAPQHPQRRLELGALRHLQAGAESLFAGSNRTQRMIARVDQRQRQQVFPGPAHARRIHVRGLDIEHVASFADCLASASLFIPVVGVGPAEATSPNATDDGVANGRASAWRDCRIGHLQEKRSHR